MTRAIVPACPPALAAQFVGVPTFRLFSAGERLYKLVNIPIDRERIVASPWWIREAEFDRLRGLSHKEGVPLGEIIRRRLAVASRWNPGMDGLCILQLARSKVGWVGPAKPQPLFNENLLGWGEQACIPDMEWRDRASTRMQVPFYQSGESRSRPLPRR
jgi:hypothetical protein